MGGGRELLAALAVCGAAPVLLATACAGVDASPLTVGAAETSQAVAPGARAIHAALVDRVLGPDGFTRQDDGGGLDGGDVFQLRGGHDVATVTFQEDLPILREHFPPLQMSPRGVQYSMEETGYGAVSILVVDGRRAVILSVVPQDPDGTLVLAAPALLARAERFLREQ